MIIFHIVLPRIWDAFIGKPSYKAESLETEGFIHCSYKHQMQGVIERYYNDEPELMILHIETEKLRSKLVEEPSTGDEVYPHIYGRINMDAIVTVDTIYNIQQKA